MITDSMIQTESASQERARYTKGEELFNILTHAFGAVFGLAVLVAGVMRSLETAKPLGILATVIYAVCMILTYTVSTVYHGLKQNAGKDVLRVLDHCAIYLLIMGTYTGIILTAILPVSQTAAMALLIIQWTLGTLSIVLTAIDMKRFMAFSMSGYIILGWCIITISHIVVRAMGVAGFLWLLSGGIAYTVGSVLYGIGRKKRYMHSVFHICCVLGSVLQFICFIAYCF